jgi:hypothetical protein
LGVQGKPIDPFNEMASIELFEPAGRVSAPADFEDDVRKHGFIPLEFCAIFFRIQIDKVYM